MNTELNFNDWVGMFFPKKKESGFFDLPEEERKCTNPEHDVPSHLHIPQGKGYRHVCPSCGKVQVVKPPQITS